YLAAILPYRTRSQFATNQPVIAPCPCCDFVALARVTWRYSASRPVRSSTARFAATPTATLHYFRVGQRQAPCIKPVHRLCVASRARCARNWWASTGPFASPLCGQPFARVPCPAAVRDHVQGAAVQVKAADATVAVVPSGRAVGGGQRMQHVGG